MSQSALAEVSAAHLTSLQDIEAAAKFVSACFGLSLPQAVTVMLISQAEGLHPVRGVMLYDVILGKPAPKATTVLARFQEAGGLVEWVQFDGKRAAANFSHPKYQPKPILVDLTIEDANARNLTKEWDREKQCWKDKFNWKNSAAAMLRARVITAGVRMIYPAALNGMHIADELMDSLVDAEVIDVRNEAPPADRGTATDPKEGKVDKRKSRTSNKEEKPPADAEKKTDAPPAKTELQPIGTGAGGRLATDPKPGDPFSNETLETKPNAKEGAELLDRILATQSTIVRDFGVEVAGSYFDPLCVTYGCVRMSAKDPRPALGTCPVGQRGALLKDLLLVLETLQKGPAKADDGYPVAISMAQVEALVRSVYFCPKDVPGHRELLKAHNAAWNVHKIGEDLGSAGPHRKLQEENASSTDAGVIRRAYYVSLADKVEVYRNEKGITLP